MKRNIRTIILAGILATLTGCASTTHGSKPQKNISSQTKNADVKVDDSLYNRKRYLIYSASFGSLFCKKAPGILSATFPYTSKDISTGIATSKTFNGNFKNPFPPNIYLIDILNMEMVSKKHFFDIGTGINSNQYSDYSLYVKIGYGHIFPVNFIQRHNRSILLFKPSVSLLFLSGYLESLGSIDNENKQISLLGYTAGNQFTTPSGRNMSGGTYNANTLDVEFKRTNFMLAPKINVSNKINKGIYWSIDVGWLLQMSNHNRFYLNQEANDDNKHQQVLATVKPGTNGLNATFNGMPFIKGPNIGGAYVGVNVGLYIWKKTPKKVALKN